MKAIAPRVLLCVCSLAVPASASADFIEVTLLGGGEVIRVNELTGEFQVIGPTGIGLDNLTRGLAGTLYTVRLPFAGSIALYTIDPRTGAASLVTSLSGPLGGNPLALAFSPIDGLLYASTGTTLYAVNPATGVTAVVGSFGPLGGGLVTALDLSPEGILYGHTGQVGGEGPVGSGLLTINTVTGQATVLTPPGVTPVLFGQTIAFAPGGSLWAASGVFAQLDLATGQSVGPIRFTGRPVTGMAFLDTEPIAEPTTAALLGTGLAGWAGLRRRRSRTIRSGE